MGFPSIKILPPIGARSFVRPSLSAQPGTDTDTLGHDVRQGQGANHPAALPAPHPSASHTMINFSRNSPVTFRVCSALAVVALC